jgi:acyl-CoA synthetase (AMP-forming)/AMP-acid ligase II/acyl carrier protein
MTGPVSGPVLVPDLLRVRAQAEPDRLALIVDGGPSITYGAWERRSNALARGLVAHGVRPGDRVGLYFDNTGWVDYAVAYLGTIKAAAVAVPLSSRFAPPELLAVLDRAGVCGLVTGTVTGPVRPRAPRWQTTADELAAGHDDSQLQAPAAQAAAGDLVEVLYTSGTTGLPKGVASASAHIVQPLVDSGGWPPPFWRECAGGVYLHANAVSTAAGQLRLWDALGPERMTVLAMPVFDANRMCQLAAEHRAAIIQLVPGMATAILDGELYRRHDMSAVRIFSLGCASFPATLVAELASAFPAATLVNIYEASETRHTGTALIYDGSRGGSVGPPRGRTELRITDAAGHDVPPGAVGEIRMRWPGLPPQYYFRDEHATAEVFQDGWTRTGDVGYRDDDGYLYIVDRIKDVVIRAGMSIPTLLVENALLEHPAVLEAAVFGVPDELYGEDVNAAVVLRAPVTDDELRAFLRDRVAAHEMPSRFAVVDELPRNPSGKVLKRELRARMSPHVSRPHAAAGVSGEGTQGVLAAIWATVLGRDGVHPDDDFFALGGDSLRATQVSARVAAAYQIELPVTTIFEHCHLADLAAVIDDLVRAGTAEPDPIPRLPRRPASPRPRLAATPDPYPRGS